MTTAILSVSLPVIVIFSYAIYCAEPDGTLARSGPRPSATVRCAITASRNRWYGNPILTALATGHRFVIYSRMLTFSPLGECKRAGPVGSCTPCSQAPPPGLPGGIPSSHRARRVCQRVCRAKLFFLSILYHYYISAE